tara:strand:+ start:409 stop:771 length:363 start_codon:yes stop_codon:yes gene_type:complete
MSDLHGIKVGDKVTLWWGGMWVRNHRIRGFACITAVKKRYIETDEGSQWNVQNGHTYRDRESSLYITPYLAEHFKTQGDEVLRDTLENYIYNNTKVNAIRDFDLPKLEAVATALGWERAE